MALRTSHVLHEEMVHLDLERGSVVRRAVKKEQLSAWSNYAVVVVIRATPS